MAYDAREMTFNLFKGEMHLLGGPEFFLTFCTLIVILDPLVL